MNESLERENYEHSNAVTEKEDWTGQREIKVGDMGSFVSARGERRACVVYGFTRDNCLKVRYCVRGSAFVVVINREEFEHD
jgi:hypothetical protein